jgi:hypothetical protein
MFLPALSRGRKAAIAVLLGTLLATLAVSAPAAMAAPKNDNLARAKSLRIGQTLKGTIKGATKQAGEPRHANSLATHSVWYRIRVSRKTTVAVNTCRTTFDTVLAIYTGRRPRGLRVVEFNNDGCGRTGGGSRVTFTARAGKTYRIAVAGFLDQGTFRIAAFRLTVPANDDFVDAVDVPVGQAVAGTTGNATRELGEPSHQFNGSHTVWFRLSVTAPTTVEVAACDAGGLTVYTGSAVGSVTRVAPTLDDGCREQFAAQPGVTYRIVVEDGGSGSPYRFSTRAVTP